VCAHGILHTYIFFQNFRKVNEFVKGLSLWMIRGAVVVKSIKEAKTMCANADKTVHLKTLIAEIKVLYAQWKKARESVQRAARQVQS